MEAYRKKHAVIIGAGPAGLTAAYELLSRTECETSVFERGDALGGISRTVNKNGYRIDIGPHRFFSKRKEILQWWTNILPLEEAGSFQAENGNSRDIQHPDTSKKHMLIRLRISRILYRRKFFNYPVSLSWETLKALGFMNAGLAALHYAFALCFKRKENSLQDFYINRFGKFLYKTFFENYTEKVWGTHPSRLSPDWGPQRVKEISLISAIRGSIKGAGKTKISPTNDQLTLASHAAFLYPKYGSGQMWESVGEEIIRLGGSIYTRHPVHKITIENNRVVSITVQSGEVEKLIPCDYLFSSMPIGELIMALEGIDVPYELKQIAQGLPYRSHITIGLVIENNADGSGTISGAQKDFPDHWIYIQETDVKIGRVFIMNNFSPFLAKDLKNHTLLGVEYFCDEGDAIWKMTKQEHITMGVEELVKINLIMKNSVVDAFVIKESKAYPSYQGSYARLQELINFLDTIENLYCIGRNGQHRYNNMDHSMLTAIEAVNHLSSSSGKGKSRVWDVNTEQDFQ